MSIELPLPTLQMFIGLMERIHPKVVHSQDCYVLESGLAGDVALQNTVKAYGNDRRKAELMYNHRHVMDFYDFLSGTMDEKSLQFVGLVYTLLLEHELKSKFPDVKFDVVVDGRDDPDGDYVISFARSENR